VHRTGTKLYLRVLATDTPEEVGNAVQEWVRDEMLGRENTERDTEITVVIGMDVNP
jgi:hypothetical protein